MSEPEIIDISNFDSDSTININNSVDRGEMRGSKSSNFGIGIELLMNDKKRNSSGSSKISSDIDVNDLNNLEDELNELTMPKKSIKSARSNMFSTSFKLNEDQVEDINMDEDDDNNDGMFSEPLNLGASTKQQSSDEKKTWDGYGKFNDIPINPDITKSQLNPN